MAISDVQKEQLNRMCPTASSVKLGDQIQNLTGTTIAHQANTTATTIADLKTDFNALLTKLIAAGLMNAE